MDTCNTKAAPAWAQIWQQGHDAVAGKRFHFIGAGGIGMSGLAHLLLKHQAVVTGSDQVHGPAISPLLQAGARIKIGHDASYVDGPVEAVVVSAAIRDDNPELQRARQRGCKVYKYAQMLGQLVNRYEGIAVAGTHGKSTTAGWLIYCLKQAGVDVNFIIGANISQLGTSSATADSPYFVAEACEYDRSFLNLRPRVSCLLNIEQDHLDYYENEQQIVEAFCQFAAGTRADGVVLAHKCDANVCRVIESLPASLRCETFGLEDDSNFSARNLRLQSGLPVFDVYRNGCHLGEGRSSLPGRHNVVNALAVVAMASHIGLPAEAVLQVLPEFTGVDRRLAFKAQLKGITVLDDYAHHPTEIRASLQAIRQRYQPRRLWCVFQPHQYSRTRFLLDDFAESFTLADVTVVPEIYFVRDTQAAQKQVNAEVLVRKIRASGSRALFIDDFTRICEYLKEEVTSGDLVVTMGAGDIWKVSDEYIQRLRADC